MARNAGVASTAVTHGAGSREELLEFGPLVCFKSIGEMAEWLLS